MQSVNFIVDVFGRGALRKGLLLCAAIFAAQISVAADSTKNSKAANANKSAKSSVSVEVQRVRLSFYMLTVEGINVAVAGSSEGVIVVNPGPASASEAVIEAIRALNLGPIRNLINTNAIEELIGGNEVVSKAGYALVAGHLGRAAPVIAHQNAHDQMIQGAGANRSIWAQPSEVFSRAQQNFYSGDQAVELIWQPAAHSNGDLVVRFVDADVVVTGAIYDSTRFPVIDLKNGGSLQGLITALGDLINKRVLAPLPVVTEEGRQTLVIPARGPIADQADLVAYRHMIMTVTERIKHLIDQGKSFEEIKSFRPEQGYELRYGAESGPGSAKDFIETAYKSLVAGAEPSTGSESP